MNTIRQRIRRSWLASSFYWRHVHDGKLHRAWIGFRSPKALEHLGSEQLFYERLFSEFQIVNVFDIGANQGDKTSTFLRAGAASITTVEPDPTSGRKLLWRFSQDRRIDLVYAAVSSRSGKMDFYQFGDGAYVNTLEPSWVEELQKPSNRFSEQFVVSGKLEVETISYDMLTTKHGVPDYAKVDVEGHEYAVIQGMSQCPRLLSLEFNLPEFQEQFEKSLRTLDRICPDIRFNYVDDYANDFRLEEWCTAIDILKHFRENELNYAEVFACREGPI